LLEYDAEDIRSNDEAVPTLCQQSATSSCRSSDGVTEKDELENIKFHVTDTNQREDIESSEGFLEVEGQQESISSIQSSRGNEIQSENATSNQLSMNTDTPLMGDEVESGATLTMPMVVKEEPLNDFSVIQAILGLNHSLAAADSSSISSDYLDHRGRPRGPKHPVWTFFKLKKTHGPTMGYMCELCGGSFSGAANTTNAAKHLRCRHKAEYAQYVQMHESAKRGAFVGDLHESLRKIMMRGRAKRLATQLGGISLPTTDLGRTELDEWKGEEPALELASSSSQSCVSPRESVNVSEQSKKSLTSPTSPNIQSKIMSVFPSLHATTSRHNTAATEDNSPEDSAKKPRVEVYALNYVQRMSKSPRYDYSCYVKGINVRMHYLLFNMHCSTMTHPNKKTPPRVSLERRR
uniref:BED-type domain-containing protein n=1 Tax=Parascaris univalens TaxID=6257 RepID=A0A915C710_PARUN